MNSSSKPVIGITVGDPAGIGPEIVLKALQDERIHRVCQPLLFADGAVLHQALDLTGMTLRCLPVSGLSEIRTAADVHYVDAGIIRGDVKYGQVQGDCGRAAFTYLSTAINWTQNGWITAIATAPINKRSLQDGGVPFLDHTAILGHFTETPHPITLFMVDHLRIFFLTRHLALRQVADALNIPMVLQGLECCDRALRQLGIPKPRLALAALNPHGGEEGLFGDEEMAILAPAVRLAREKGLEIHGPVPADSVFHLALKGEFDGVLSLYHDQGHIAAKTYDFHRTVSLTMGLPFLRSSVDHGTAFDLAGRNSAIATGMIEAILAAALYGPKVRAYPALKR